MSHLPERKEKTCLNCGASLSGRYCHICGQENIEPRENFWQLLTHFVYDIMHFDGKFFSTLKYLLFKPGFLSHEYLKGRRADYLHPIRMYVFTSAFFFLIFFSFYQKEDTINITETPTSAVKIMRDLEKDAKNLQKKLQDSLSPQKRKALSNSLRWINSDIEMLKNDTTATYKLNSTSKRFTLMSFGDETDQIKSLDAYDSLQRLLPPVERHGYIKRKFKRQELYLNEKYKGDGRAILESISTKFWHLFPQMLFISLPFFALILQLLYVRRKQFFYVNHVVYAIHLYCATFIIILFGLWTYSLVDKIKGFDSDWVGILFTLAAFFYWYKGIRNFYGQRRAKSIFKYTLVMFFALLLMAIIFSAFFIFSALTV